METVVLILIGLVARKRTALGLTLGLGLGPGLGAGPGCAFAFAAFPLPSAACISVESLDPLALALGEAVVPIIFFMDLDLDLMTDFITFLVVLALIGVLGQDSFNAPFHNFGFDVEGNGDDAFLPSFSAVPSDLPSLPIAIAIASGDFGGGLKAPHSKVSDDARLAELFTEGGVDRADGGPGLSEELRPLDTFTGLSKAGSLNCLNLKPAASLKVLV